MAGGEVATWIGIVVSSTVAVASAVAYAHSLRTKTEDTMRQEMTAVRTSLEGQVKDCQADLEGQVRDERDERRREIAKIDAAIESFRQVGVEVRAVAEGVRFMGERLEDHRTASSQALAEIKHSVRNLDMKVQALPGSALAAAAALQAKQAKGD